MMERFTQKELREYVIKGIARDMSKYENGKELERLRLNNGLTKIGSSAGVYGCNGGLFKDDNNNLYVIVGRCSNLWLVS